MKISLFKIGLVLVVIGIIWMSMIFVETDKINESIILQKSNSIEMKLGFDGIDLGFYKIYMPEFSGDEIFVQILDTHENVIDEQKIQTKMSVGYFDHTTNGVFTIKVTNISKNSIPIEIEFGDTNSKEMIPGGILVLVGSITLIVMSFFRLKNYNIEQPDENIS